MQTTAPAPSSTGFAGSLGRRIASYSVAAAGITGATGVFSSEAEAAIVYSGVQDIAINLGNFLNLNLDGDVYQDIKLKNYNFFGGPYQGATVNYFPGKLVGFSSGINYATALADGALIGSSTLGPGFAGSLAYGTVNTNAQFNLVSGAFIGLSFPISGQTHYGWVRVTINNAAGLFTVNDWAYESTPGTGINAGATSAIPEPASAGLLAALTVGGAVAMRRRRSTA